MTDTAKLKAENELLREALGEAGRKVADERIERRRAEHERDRLQAELDEFFAKQEGDVAEMVEGQVVEILGAAEVDGWTPDDATEWEVCHCCRQRFNENELDHDTLTCQNCLGAAMDIHHLEAGVLDLRAVLTAMLDTLDWEHYLATDTLSQHRSTAIALLHRAKGVLAATEGLVSK